MASYYLNNASIARALAWAAMNGADENTLVGGLRDVTALVEQMETEAASPRDADILFAFAASAVLGVTVFGGVGLAAAGAKPDQDRHDLHALTIDLIASVVEQARPGPNPS